MVLGAADECEVEGGAECEVEGGALVVLARADGVGALVLCGAAAWDGTGVPEAEVEVGAAGIGAAAEVVDEVEVSAEAADELVAVTAAELELPTPAPAARGAAEPAVADWHAAAARTVIAQAKADAHRCRSMIPSPQGRLPARPAPIAVRACFPHRIPAPAAGQGPTLAEN